MDADDAPMTEEEIQRSGHRPEDLVPPPDRPKGAEGRTTASEHRDGGSLDERLEEEEPEGSRGTVPAAGQSLMDDDPDREKDVVAEEGQPESGDEPSAEEAAIHEVEEDAAPDVTDGPDRYVDDR